MCDVGESRDGLEEFSCSNGEYLHSSACSDCNVVVGEGEKWVAWRRWEGDVRYGGLAGDIL